MARIGHWVLLFVLLSPEIARNYPLQGQKHL
jgi:hypothetical protein